MGTVTQPNTPEHAGDEHEQYAGADTSDGFAQDPQEYQRTKESVDAKDATPPNLPNEIANQRPEEVEFGRRATEFGDPEGEDRPNGDPETVGHPVGGGERSPDVSGDQEDARES